MKEYGIFARKDLQGLFKDKEMSNAKEISIINISCILGAGDLS